MDNEVKNITESEIYRRNIQRIRVYLGMAMKLYIDLALAKISFRRLVRSRDRRGTFESACFLHWEFRQR